MQAANEGGTVLSRGIGLRLLFEHFSTVLERERRASRSHRKRVTFVTPRAALEPELDLWPWRAEGLLSPTDPPPPPPPPSPVQSQSQSQSQSRSSTPTGSTPNTERTRTGGSALLQACHKQSENDQYEEGDVVLISDSGVESSLSSSDSSLQTNAQASPGTSSLLAYKMSTTKQVSRYSKESLSRVSVTSAFYESSRTQSSTTRIGRRRPVVCLVDNSISISTTSSSNASHSASTCPPAAAALTGRRLGSLDTRAPPSSGALSVLSLLTRAGLRLPNSELDTPTRRWVRSVHIAGHEIGRAHV